MLVVSDNTQGLSMGWRVSFLLQVFCIVSLLPGDMHALYIYLADVRFLVLSSE